MAWTWLLHGSGGVAPPQAQAEGLAAGPGPVFPSQAEAESWIGEQWRDLLDRGVEAVTLQEDGRQVYGPMSLRPGE